MGTLDIPKYEVIVRFPVLITSADHGVEKVADSAATISGSQALGARPVAEAVWRVEMFQTPAGEHERAWSAWNIDGVCPDPLGM